MLDECAETGSRGRVTNRDGAQAHRVRWKIYENLPWAINLESTPTITPLGRSLSHWTQSRPSIPGEPTLRICQLESTWRSAWV